MTDSINYLIEEFVWWDFRLATIFTVILPLGLLIGAVISKNSGIRRSLTIYWRVSALLAITVYLLIGNLAIGYITGWIARILIPVSLWFWQDLNQAIHQDISKLKIGYVIWRWIMSAYCAIGTFTGLAFLPCSLGQEFSPGVCALLSQAPQQFKAILHPNVTAEFLGNASSVALIAYAIYFAIFLSISLPRHGRTAVR
jgi:Protein of unknown function (DUF3177)